MTEDIWLNLPVKDLAKSVAFFADIGFTHKPGPGNSAHSASFSIGKKEIILMLFAQDMFAGFTHNALSDTTKGTEVLFSLGADSREQVNDITNRARQAGGTVFAEPGESNGFMYGSGFCDPDGHRWNLLFMDLSNMPKP